MHRRHRFTMCSSLLVAAQFALIVLIAVPFDVQRWSVAATLLVAAGTAVGAWAMAVHPPGNFNIRPEPPPTSRLVTHGPYAWVRHPMYLAVLLAALGCGIGYATAWRFGAWLALAAVLAAKATIEEAALAAKHPEYAHYRARTRRIVPFVW